MTAVGDALNGCLLAGVPLPDPDRVMEGNEDESRATRIQLARDEAGIAPGAPLPPTGTAQRKTYRTAMRRMQRYTTDAGQRRKPSADVIRRAGAALRGIIAGANVRRARADGLAMWLIAWIRVSKTKKRAEMRAGTNGPVHVHIDGSLLGPCLDAWIAGDTAAAEVALMAAFFVAYWGNPAPAEISEIEAADVRF